jgi:hypothetical protein
MWMSKDPWAIDSTMRTGIHSMLRLDRANKELVQLASEFQQFLSWGVRYHTQIKNWIDKCVFGLSQSLIQVHLMIWFWYWLPVATLRYWWRASQVHPRINVWSNLISNEATC